MFINEYLALTPLLSNLSQFNKFPSACFFYGSNKYKSRLKGCQTSWKVHDVTLENWNTFWVFIKHLKDLYSASSSSVTTNLFKEQINSPYKLRKACRKMTWNTHFFDEGIIVKFPGNVLPVGVLIAILNNFCLYRLVPVSLW